MLKGEDVEVPDRRRVLRLVAADLEGRRRFGIGKKLAVRHVGRRDESRSATTEAMRPSAS